MKEIRLESGEISSLCMELSLLFHAGIGVSDGLHLLAEENPQNRELLEGMAKQADLGKPLSEAMQASGAFPDYAVGMAAVGEKSGRTEEALHALSDYYDGRERLFQRIRSALLYPAVLLLLMVVVIAVLLMKVLPVFNDVYTSLGGQLTGLAGGLLAFGQALDAAMPFLCVLLAAAVIFLAAFASSDSFRDAILRRRSLRGGDMGIFRGVASARFAQALSMGLSSGLTIEDSIQMASTLHKDNPAAVERYRDCLARMEKGSGLADAMRESGALPPACCSILALGMRGGSGDTVMAEIARRLEEESEADISARVGRVEPTLVIVTSLLVGVILLSVMLPLMNIMAAIG